MTYGGLVSFLEGYSESGIYPFHMPGHKSSRDFLHKGLLGMDITEIPYSDNLHDASGVILKMQEKIARLFGADESFLTVNGSSSAVIAAVCTACADGGQILAARNAHRSFFSGLIFSDAKPVYVMPKMTSYGFSGSVDPADIKKALKENSDVKAVFITSPTYEGIVSDIAEIAAVSHEAGKLLIVDEAHGSHFNFSGIFPKSAVECGADIVINGLHKTLPFLTQTAVLHVCGGLADRSRLKKYLSMTQTSSPSYVIMGQADFCVGLLEEKGKYIFNSYAKMLKDFRIKTADLENILLVGEDILNEVFDIDIGKLTFYINSDKMSGFEAEKLLTQRHGVQVEAGFEKHIIAMTSCADTQAGYALLYDGLSKMDKEIAGDNAYIVKPRRTEHNFPLPDVAMTPRAAINQKSKQVPLKDSENEISAEFITPFPPGIPLLAPGERITTQIIQNNNIKFINIVTGGEK